jgi:hypothetical protein
MASLLSRIFSRRPLKLIGYWANGDDEESPLPLPQDLVGLMSIFVRDAVCKYLAAGQPYESYRGHSWCRFSCGVENREMGSKELTDGEWVWPEGLIHYVRVHSVVLPHEFIADATSGRTPHSAASRRASLDFWLEWAAHQKSRTGASAVSK